MSPPPPSTYSQCSCKADKATSELRPTDEEDMALNLEICDQIKAKIVPAKDAMRALKRRLNHKNPNVQLLALTVRGSSCCDSAFVCLCVLSQLTDVCVKNGGNHFLTEVASREFMDNLVSILKIPVRQIPPATHISLTLLQGLNIDVKNRILRHLQNWAIALEGKPLFSYVNQVYKTLGKEGDVCFTKMLSLTLMLFHRLYVSSKGSCTCQ